MEYDTYLFNLYTRLRDISKDEFSTFINNADTTYGKLNTSFNSVSDLIYSAKWDDDVKTKIQNNIDSIKKVISQCESYAKDVVIPLASETELLATNLKKYYGIYSKEEKFKKQYYGENELEDYTSLQDFYNKYYKWIENQNLFRKLMNKFYQYRLSDNNANNEGMMNGHIIMVYHEILSYYQSFKSRIDSDYERKIGSQDSDYIRRLKMKTNGYINNNTYNSIKNNDKYKYGNNYHLYESNMRARIMREKMLKMNSSNINKFRTIDDDLFYDDSLYDDSFYRLNSASFPKVDHEKKEFIEFVKNCIERQFRPKDEYSGEAIYASEAIDETLKANTLAKECYESIKKINELLSDEEDLGKINKRIEYYNKKIEIIENKAEKYKITSKYASAGIGDAVTKVGGTVGAIGGALGIGAGAAATSEEDITSIEQAVTSAQQSVEETPSEDESSTSNESKIHFIGTGSSDAILLESNGHFGLIDACYGYNDGTRYPASNVKESVQHVINYLNGRGAKKLDFVVGTHNHCDHIGGMPGLANSGLVQSGMPYYYRPYGGTKEDSTTDWDNGGYGTRAVNAMRTVGANVINVTGTYPVIKLGDFTIQLLNTEAASASEYENGVVKGENKNAIVEVVTYKGRHKTLLASDMEYEDEMKVAKLVGSVEVLKMGHHSYATANQPDYISTITPKQVIVTNTSIDNANIPIVYYMQNCIGSAVHLTGSNDAIVVDYNDSGYTVSPYSPIPAYGVQAVEGNWRKVNGSWMYIAGNKASQGWVQDGSKWYYIGLSGAMVTGWQHLEWNGGTYWFYFQTSGEMATGWQQITWSGGTNWFYFDPTTGIMAQNKTLDLDGKRYEFDNNGVAHEKGNASSSSSSSSTSSSSDGWSQENGKWIYKQGGQKTTGWKEISWSGGTDWFYFDGNGEMKTGWQQINWDGGNKWFYFDPTNGNMYKNTTVTIDGTSYHFDGNGVCSG